MARRANNRPQVPFADKLVLNQWVLSLFDVKRFEELADHLHDEALEGLDENNIHRFHHALTTHHSGLTQLPTELLLEYDQNIVTHTQRLNERRITRGEEPIVWCLGAQLAISVHNCPVLADSRKLHDDVPRAIPTARSSWLGQPPAAGCDRLTCERRTVCSEPGFGASVSVYLPCSATSCRSTRRRQRGMEHATAL